MSILDQNQKVYNLKEAEQWFLNNSKGNVTCICGVIKQAACCYSDAVVFFRIHSEVNHCISRSENSYKITDNKDFNKDNFNCKYDDCKGTQIKFLGSSQDGIESAQFKCNKCHKYMSIVDGNKFFTNRYNFRIEGTNETK